MTEPTRYVTTWRKSGSILDWDSHVSESAQEADRVVADIRERGELQYRTYALGGNPPVLLPDLSSEY